MVPSGKQQYEHQGSDKFFFFSKLSLAVGRITLLFYLLCNNRFRFQGNIALFFFINVIDFCSDIGYLASSLIFTLFCPCSSNAAFNVYKTKLKTKLNSVVFSPQANYTDRATAAWRS
jgi:hypothetical protein